MWRRIDSGNVGLGMGVWGKEDKGNVSGEVVVW